MRRGTLLYATGQFLVSQANKRASSARHLPVKPSLLTKGIKLLCELAGWGCFVYAAFLITSVAGFVTAGIALLILAMRIEVHESEEVTTSTSVPDPLVRR